MSATGPASGPAALDILAEIRAEVNAGGTICGAGRFIDTMTEGDREAIKAALAEGIQGAAIARFLQKRGCTVKTEPAVRHLKGRCGCPPIR